MISEDEACTELLHSLGYLYMRSGQNNRSLVFLLIANRVDPENVGVLRTLAATFIALGAGERAINVIDRLVEVEGDVSASAALLLSRALWITGKAVEARASFRKYVELRRL